ncbi:MAG TPA: capsid cement protein [Thermomicrobiales bacterium]|nr:capsid cement protein [Thermomicrobiales bacterium]
MAYEQIDPGDMRTYKANVDLSADQYRFVAIVATDSVPPLCGLPSAGGGVAGVLQNAPSTGLAATVAAGGISKVYAGAAIAAGDYVAAGADGRALTATTGQERVGRALRAASGAGIVIPVDLDAPGLGKA